MAAPRATSELSGVSQEGDWWQTLGAFGIDAIMSLTRADAMLVRQCQAPTYSAPTSARIVLAGAQQRHISPPWCSRQRQPQRQGAKRQ